MDRDRIRAIHRNGNRIEREFEEKETSEHQNGGEEIDIESREHMRAYRHMMKIYSAFAMFFGINVSYSYRPTRSYMFWFANFMLIATWTNIIYTVTFHCKNGQYKRVLEPLAISGVAYSVNRQYLLEQVGHIRCHKYDNLFSLDFCRAYSSLVFKYFSCTSEKHCRIVFFIRL